MNARFSARLVTAPTGGWRGTLVARFRARRERDRQSGVAFLITIASLSLLIALVVSVHLRDDGGLSPGSQCARRGARALSGPFRVSLSRLLIKIQLRFVEPIMQTAQKMLADQTGQDLGISLRVTDYATPQFWASLPVPRWRRALSGRADRG
jgi:hypothetical protein